MRRPSRLGLLLAATLALALALAACGSGSGLTGKTWQWTASTTKTPASQSVVPDPQNYTIEFKSDGTFAAKADCNQVSGAYTTTSSGGITITPGPTTLAVCGANSAGDLYVTGLRAAQTYKVDGGTLTLTLVADATMTFK